MDRDQTSVMFDKAMMLDPETSDCRIFVKNTQNANRQDIEDFFKKFGNIVGVMQQRNYCFIQYENPESATEAIQQAHGAPFLGKTLDVSQARKPMDKAALNAHKAQQQQQRGGGRGGQRGGGGGVGRDRSPLRDTWDDPRYEYEYGSRGRAPYGDTYYASRTMADLQQDRTNDVEIIVHQRKQRAYAEMIEDRLKNFGMTVDLLFPNESIPVTKVLANISSRGTLYAITVSPQNEEHCSLTLNMLHGSREEHRNMPLEAALQLIVQNYESYMRDGGTKVGSTTLSNVPKAAILVATNHPENITAMLQLLCQNRSLTVLQYDTLLRYLSQRREQQVKLEVGDSNISMAPPIPITIPPEPTPVPPPQAEQLQKRIMSILDKKLVPGAPVVPTVPSVVATNKEAQRSNIMHDPKVQMALSNLFSSGNLLKNIGKKD